MKLGILALAIILLCGGAKNLKDSKAQEKQEARRGKLYFGVVMLVTGALTLLAFILYAAGLL